MARTMDQIQPTPAPGTRPGRHAAARSALPSVSIIINNFNYAHYLTDAIDSALAQTHPDTEVIVVDDGSSDNSRLIIQEYGDRIIPVFKENGGQASAFNAGFKVSHGDVIIFLDADDCLDPETADLVAKRFQRQPDLCLAMYRLQVIDGSGHLTGAIKPDEYFARRSGNLRRHYISFPFDMTRMATSGNAFAAWALHFVMPIPVEDYPRINADWYINYIIPLFGSVAFLDDVGGSYRVHGKNNFEQSVQEVDLQLVRQIINDDRRTARHIADFACKLRLIAKPSDDKILSVSYLANRVISYKLDPEHHPIAGERILNLLLLGIRASFRRFDVSIPMRIIFALWFIAASLGPRRLTHWLAIKLMFPESRPNLNTLLGRLHHV